MTVHDLLVRGGTVVSSSAATPADVAIDGERVVAVGALAGRRARREIDAAGCYVLPGVIDAHTHPVYADDLGGMTRAGLAAGVTTSLAFVGAFPSWGFEKTTATAVVDAYLDRWDGQAATDFGLHVAFDSVDDPRDQVPRLVERGISSFKFFTAYRQRGMMVDDRTLLAGLEAVAAAGGIALVHAENGDGIEYLEGRVWDQPELPNSAYLACHTHLLEAEAVMRVIALADVVGCPLYIPHLAAGSAVDLITLGRGSTHAPVWVETCPHYLVLTNDEVLERGALSKIAPPLRTSADGDRLWEAVRDGVVQVVATDHAGRTTAMKAEGANILQAPYGAEGIEHLLPLLWSEGVAAGRISSTRLVAVLAENPADLFGLAPRKGRIAEGADADLVVLDPEGTSTCSVAHHVGASDYCLYEGRALQGRVRDTVRRGEVVLEDGRLVDVTTGGRYLPRAAPGPGRLPLVDGVTPVGVG